MHDRFLQQEEGFSISRLGAFTLVELLVVLGIIAILCTILMPVISSAMENARVAKVHAEIRQIGMTLDMYFEDHKKYPPVRVSCNTEEREHWCELPSELVSLGYLPDNNKKGISSLMEDPFNPGHTYKYATPGPYYLNGSLQRDGFSVYVPDDFPVCKSGSGAYQDTRDSMVAWAVWSLGPRQRCEKALSSHAPLSAATWYTGGRDNGVIARIKPRNGESFQTPETP